MTSLLAASSSSSATVSAGSSASSNSNAASNNNPWSTLSFFSKLKTFLQAADNKDNADASILKGVGVRDVRLISLMIKG